MWAEKRAEGVAACDSGDLEPLRVLLQQSRWKVEALDYKPLSATQGIDQGLCEE